MAADIDDFLATVVAQAASQLELTDRTTEEIVTTDQMVLGAARIAYSQAIAFLNRNLAYDTFQELYSDVEDRFRLRNTPVDTVSRVYSEDGFLLVEDVDYKVVGGNYLQLDVLSTGYNYAITTGADADHYHCAVEYTGGYRSAEQEPIIETALIFQTIANYNRRKHLGISLITASSSGFKGGAIRIAPDRLGAKTSLIGEAEEMLSPYIYYGSAQPWVLPAPPTP